MSRLFLACTLLLVGCGGPTGPRNPPRLFITLNGSESMIKLVPVEPEPF